MAGFPNCIGQSPELVFMDESVNSEWFISLQLSPKFLYEKRHVVLFISRDHRRDDLKEKFKRFGQQDENRYTIIRKGLGQLVCLPVIEDSEKKASEERI